ncbi:MAG: c-type cytochrome [Rhodospirillales bacterium]
MKSIRTGVVLGVAGAVLAISAMLIGPDGATAARADKTIAYRKMVMGATGAHIGAIASVVKGETNYAAHVGDHARAIAGLARMMTDIFPEGSGEGNTRAKPEIWKDWPRFMAAAKALETAAMDLAMKADSGDMGAIGAGLGAVGKSCGGCHEPFRKPAK